MDVAQENDEVTNINFISPKIITKEIQEPVTSRECGTDPYLNNVP